MNKTGLPHGPCDPDMDVRPEDRFPPKNNAGSEFTTYTSITARIKQEKEHPLNEGPRYTFSGR
jgi:hypothetical protein